MRWAVLGVAILLIVGAVYERLAQRRDLERFPPPGIFVDAGELRMHIYCEGTGSPTVIGEAGATQFSLAWRHVLPIVSQDTRMCAYDRPGFGWSDISPEVPTPETVSKHLKSTLSAAAVEGPYIVVGHSFGGIYVRDFAARYPREVVGMVLVDSSHENQEARLPDELRERQERGNPLLIAAMRICQAAAKVGIPRAFRVWNLLSDGLPEDIRPVYVMTWNRQTYCPAVRQELLAIASETANTALPQRLGSLPLIVLTHGVTEADTAAEETWEATWQELQADLASLSSNADHRVIADAGHNIHVERPDAVATAILELVVAAR